MNLRQISRSISSRLSSARNVARTAEPVHDPSAGERLKWSYLSMRSAALSGEIPHKVTDTSDTPRPRRGPWVVQANKRRSNDATRCVFSAASLARFQPADAPKVKAKVAIRRAERLIRSDKKSGKCLSRQQARALVTEQRVNLSSLK